MKRLLLLALGLASASVPAITTYSEGLTRSSQAQHWQQLRPPQLSDFGYENPFPPELARVGTDFNNDLSFTPAAEPRVLHFDADGRLQSEPQKDGYFRKILGTTAEGQTVAQDFYQDGEKPQTAPFILNPGHEEDFEETCINGRNIWFNRDGSVSQIALVPEGKRQGWGLMVKDGRYFVAARDGDLLRLNDQGQPVLLLTAERVILFYNDGGAMSRKDWGSKQVYNWNAAGRSVDRDELDEEILDLRLNQLSETLAFIEEKTGLEAAAQAVAEAKPSTDSKAKVPMAELLTLKLLQVDLKLPAAVRQPASAHFDNDLKFTPAAKETTYYFDANSEPDGGPREGGYFRKILGTTAEGQTVVQDFYQDSGTPQTAPFLLRPGYEHNFAAEGNDGRIIWYEKDGSISSLSHYRNGKAQGWEFNFHEGRLYSLFRANPADQTFALLVLDEEEKPQVLLLGSSEEEFGPRIAAFYDLDGRPRRPQDADTATRELGQQRAKTALEWFRKQFLE